MAELLKEAIADAKAVREVALQNAKMALEEAFDSKLKSMLSAKLAEEIEEDVELEETYDEDEKSEGMKYDEDDKVDEASYDEDDKMDEASDEDLDEEINLDELMAELEEMSYEEDMDEGKKDDEEVKEAEDVEEGIGAKLAGTIKGVGKAFSLFTTPEDTADDLRKTLAKNPELKNDEKFMAMLKAVDQFAQGGSAAGAAKRAEESTTFDIDALVAEIESEIEEGKKKKKDDDDKVEEAYGDSPGKGTGPAKGKPGAPFGDGKSGKGSTGYDGAVKQLKEERDAALKTVTTLKETISEMNLLNSKLLYCNKLFRANALNEAQKVKVVDALDKATTTGEAKLVFETLQESFNFTGVEKRAIKEGLARASKPVGTAPKKVLSESVDETVSRFQKLANINK